MTWRDANEERRRGQSRASALGIRIPGMLRVLRAGALVDELLQRHFRTSSRKPEPPAGVQDLDSVDPFRARIVDGDPVTQLLRAVDDLSRLALEVDVHRVGLGIVGDLHGSDLWLKYT